MEIELSQRLEQERIIWMATVRADGRPHLVPIWFVFHDGLIFVCMQEGSVKSRNLAQNPRVALSLEDGVNPVIGEGVGKVVERPFPEVVVAMFQGKYEWDIVHSEQYRQLIQVRVEKWLHWTG